jgi:hypothetical protein
MQPWTEAGGSSLDSSFCPEVVEWSPILLLIMDMETAPSNDSLTLAGFQGSVSAVVELMQTELDSLQARREEIRERIRNLHHVIYGLQEIGGPESDDVLAESLNPGGRRGTNRQNRSTTAIDQHAAGEWRSCVRGHTGYTHPALKRACRIALLEGEPAASVKEIYSRIVRRGSFQFDTPRLAHLLVARALNVMTEKGEIRCFKNDTLWRWQRLPRREDPDADLGS